MAHYTVRAWIEQTNSGLDRKPRFIVVSEGVLFPGTRQPYSASWADRRGARAFIERNRLDFQRGDCPLPAVTQEQRDAYHAEVKARRAAAAAKREG